MFDDVVGHLDVEGLFVIIPIQFDATVEVAQPILGKSIFCFNHCNQMVHVLLTLVFHTKIIDNEGGGDGMHNVFPETQGILAFIITMGGETLANELVGKDASLWQSLDGFSHLEVDVASNDLLLEVTFGDDSGQEQTYEHLHIFVPVECCCELEIANVKVHVTPLWDA